MARVLKVVAILLLLSTGAIPVLAAASCPSQVDSGMHCPPGCPMMKAMAKSAPVSEIQSRTTGESCCNISSGKPAPIAELQLPSGSTVIDVPQLTSSAIGVLPTEHRTASSIPPPLLSQVVSTQSALCTFLI